MATSPNNLLALFPTKETKSSSPLDIPGCVLWLDGQDLATITKDVSGNVSQWNDKSTSANNATSSGLARPVYTANSINTTFPGLVQTGVQYLDLTSSITPSSGGTIFAVFQFVSAAGVQAILGNEPIGGTYPSFTSGTTVEIYDGNSFADFSASLAAATPYLITAVINVSPATASVSLNGSPLSSAGTGFASWATAINLVGARTHALWNLVGAYGEIVIYDRDLSSIEISQLTTYEQTKWGL